MNKKTVRFYNVLFPFWMLLLIPQIWFLVLSGNFLIDSIVLIISMAIYAISDKKRFYKKHIVKVYLFGLLSDFIGSGYMLIMMLVFEVGKMGDELYLTIPALLISFACIYLFNYFLTFKNIDKAFRFKFSLIFAIVTAPYTFLIPSSWLYY